MVSERSAYRQKKSAPCTWHGVVFARPGKIGVREVVLVGQVVAVELNDQRVGDLVADHAIQRDMRRYMRDLDRAGNGCIVGTCLDLADIVQAKTRLQSVVEIVDAPEIGLVVRGVGNWAMHAWSGKADGRRVEISIARDDFPVRRQAPLCIELKTVHMLGAG